MKKSALLCLPLLLLTLSAAAQTKRIAHYSHSGSDRSFRDGGSDNFGIIDKSYRERPRFVDSAVHRKQPVSGTSSQSAPVHPQTPPPQPAQGQQQKAAMPARNNGQGQSRGNNNQGQ